MAKLPDNIASFLAVDFAGNVVNVDASLFVTDSGVQQSTPQRTVSLPTSNQQAVGGGDTIINNITQNVSEPFLVGADSFYIPLVNSDKSNFINSSLYQSGVKIGINTRTPSYLLDVYGGSINITNSSASTTFGYKIDGNNIAYADITNNKIVLGSSTNLSKVDINSLILSGLINSPATGITRYLSIDDLGLVSATEDVDAARVKVRGRNTTGSTLYAGTIIYLSGSTGNRPNFVKAQANSELTSSRTFGAILYDIPNNTDGYVLVLGYNDTLDTRTSAPHPFTSDTLVDGDQLYLSPTTAGYVTNVKPSAPNHIVYIGKVTRTSPTNGTIVYQIQNGYELDELHNVAISSVSDEQALIYEASTNLWKNKTLFGATGIFSTTDITEGTNLYYTDARARNAISVSAPITYNSTTGVIGITQATSTTNGYLSSTDWNTFNNKQNALSGTTNYVAKFSSASNLGNSQIVDDGTSVLIGLTSRRSSFNQGVTVEFQIEGQSFDTAAGSIVRNSNDVGAPKFVLGKTRGTTVLSNTAVTSGDFLGNIEFQGGDGTTLVVGSSIRAIIDGTVSTSNMPAALAFYTYGIGNTVTERMRIGSNGNIGIGSISNINTTNLYVARPITGGVNSYAIFAEGTVQSDVTSGAYYFRTTAGTQAASFTLPALYHYHAQNTTFGAGSTVTSQFGYSVSSNFTNATNNYAYYSALASGTGRWNLYMAGSANNYLAGNLLIGTTTDNGYKLDVNGNVRFSAIYGTNYKNVWTGYVTAANYWLIAQLPATSAATGEGVYIEIVSNTNSVSGKGKVKIALGQRNSFWYVKSYEGGTPQFGIRVYQATAGGVSNVYLYNTNNSFVAANCYYTQYGWGGSGSATLYDNPTPTTTAPTDTLIFDSADNTTYPVNDNLNIAALTATTGAFSGSVGIGTTSLTNSNLRISKNITGSIQTFTLNVDGQIQADVTSEANLIRTQSNQIAGATLTNLVHFAVNQGTISGTLTNQIGFSVGSITGGTNIYGFSGNVASGTGRWNLYMGGTASNYLAGSLGIGTTSVTGYNIIVAKAITGATNSTGILQGGAVQSDVTSGGFGFYNQLNTQALPFTMSSYRHYQTESLTIGQGSVIGTQRGFEWGAISSAKINYGYYGNGNLSRAASATISSYSVTTNVVTLNTSAAHTIANGSRISVEITSLTSAATLVVGVPYRIVSVGTTDFTTVGAASNTVGLTFTATATTFTGTGTLCYPIQGSNYLVTSVGSTTITFSLTTTNTTGSVTVSGGTVTQHSTWNIYMAGTADNYLGGSLGIGTTTLAGYVMNISKTITGATTSYGIYLQSAVQSDVTSVAYYNRTFASTQAASFTLTSLVHYYASQGSIGAGSTVTNQYGFYVEANLVGAANNIAFYGLIPSGSGRWNIYMGGTANNYLAGSLGIGTTSLTNVTLSLGKNITGATSSYSILAQSQIQSDVTANAYYFRSLPSTQATTFTLSNLYHYSAGQSTIGAGSTVGAQVGYNVEATLVGATYNYGYQGNIPSGTNNWNLYMGGTANNYIAGNLWIGLTSSTYKVDVSGTVNATALRITGGTSSQYLMADGTTSTLTDALVTGKLLTGLTITGTAVQATDSILVAIGKLQSQVNGLSGSLSYRGTWNASTNTPTITSGVGTNGYFYIVSVAGTTTIDGISSWAVGDWIIFNGTAWQKVANNAVTSVNGFTGAVTLTTSNITEGTNLYYTNARAIAAPLTGYVSGAGTISATDTILQAIQKLNGNVTALVTGVSSVFGRTGVVVAASGDYNTSQVTESTNLYFTNARAIASTLTGYVSSTGTITSSDTILTAIQKLNGNFNAVFSGTTAQFIKGNGTIGEIATDLDTDITGVKDGSNQLFTISANFVTNSTRVFVNGVRMQRGSTNDYIEVGSNQIQFTFAPSAGDVIVVDYIK